MGSEERVIGISMGTRARRRKLVVVCYALLVLVPFGVWLGTGNLGGVTMTAVYGAIAINGLAFGGLRGFFGTARGLVKPFANTPPREPGMQEELIRLRLERWNRYLRLDDTSWRNDERELRRRDAVHYRAYQPLAAAMAVVVLIAQWSLYRPAWLPATVLPVALYGLALPTAILAITLPQAIILWTEPDMVGPEDSNVKELAFQEIGKAFEAKSKA
jgi:hypothetical protein